MSTKAVCVCPSFFSTVAARNQFNEVVQKPEKSYLDREVCVVCVCKCVLCEFLKPCVCSLRQHLDAAIIEENKFILQKKRCRRNIASAPSPFDAMVVLRGSSSSSCRLTESSHAGGGCFGSVKLRSWSSYNSCCCARCFERKQAESDFLQQRPNRASLHLLWSGKVHSWKDPCL